MFAAVQGLQYASDIAVDDIQLREGCLTENLRVRRDADDEGPGIGNDSYYITSAIPGVFYIHL